MNTRDVVEPDGTISSGWRLVRKGGVVKFIGYVWTHPDLENRVGEKIYIYRNDYWGVEASFCGDPERPYASTGRLIPACFYCHKASPHDESACVHCGKLKPWVEQ